MKGPPERWVHQNQFNARGRAHLPFAQQAYFNVDHNTLVSDDTGTTYETLFNWITEGLNSDGDGLTDDSEVYYHGTDPFDSDSDNDDLSDYDEVTREDATNPNYWDSDGDGIGDGYEVQMQYDPLNPSNPVPASSLISSVTVVDSTRTVKVYVRYKTKTGSWTYPYYKRIDDSPNTGGDYYKTWTHPTGYIQMKVMVAAYNSDDHWLGSDDHICSITYGSGGGHDPPLPPLD